MCVVVCLKGSIGTEGRGRGMYVCNAILGVTVDIYGSGVD